MTLLLRNRLAHLEALTRKEFYNGFQIKDIKLKLHVKSLKPLRKIQSRLREGLGEATYSSNMNHVVRIFFGKDITLNIPHGKKIVQVQGIKKSKDIELLFLRLKDLGFHVVGDAELSTIVCTIPLPIIGTYQFHLPVEPLRHGLLKFGTLKLCLKNDHVTLRGRSLDEIEEYLIMVAKV